MKKKMLDYPLTAEDLDRAIHDLKTPLTNVKTFGHLLERRLQDKDGQLARYASKIQSNVDRASMLINTFARELRQTLKNKG